MNRPPRKRRRWLRWSLVTLAALVIVVVGAVTAVTLTTHAPAPLVLPSAQSAAPAPAAASLTGVWNAGPGSTVGWRAEQVLIGEQSTLSGRTGEVWGSITIASGAVTAGAFTVDMAALTSSLSQASRNSAFDVASYPTAQLLLTSPIVIGSTPARGVVQNFSETATLTLHGVSRPVHFTVSTEVVGADLYVLSDIPLPFEDWGVSLGGVPFLADIDSPATIEVLLHLSRGPGTPASVADARSPSTGTPR